LRSQLYAYVEGGRDSRDVMRQLAALGHEQAHQGGAGRDGVYDCACPLRRVRGRQATLVVHTTRPHALVRLPHEPSAAAAAAELPAVAYGARQEWSEGHASLHVYKPPSARGVTTFVARNRHPTQTLLVQLACRLGPPGTEQTGGDDGGHVGWEDGKATLLVTPRGRARSHLTVVEAVPPRSTRLLNHVLPVAAQPLPPRVAFSSSSSSSPGKVPSEVGSGRAPARGMLRLESVKSDRSVSERAEGDGEVLRDVIDNLLGTDGQPVGKGKGRPAQAGDACATDRGDTEKDGAAADPVDAAAAAPATADGDAGNVKLVPPTGAPDGADDISYTATYYWQPL
jgi:hypothetical protein